VRAYASEQPGTSTPEERSARHARGFLELAEAAVPHLRGADQAVWLDRLEAERDNLRAALTWAVHGEEWLLGVRLAGALWQLWEIRGPWPEGRHWLDTALARRPDRELPPSDPELGAICRALEGSSVLARLLGDYRSSRARMEEAVALQRRRGHPEQLAWALNQLASVVGRQGDYPAARALYEESLAIQRERNDTVGIGAVLGNLGRILFEEGDYATAQARNEESLALFRSADSPRGIAVALNNLGLLAMTRGDLEAATPHFEEVLAISRRLGHRIGIKSGLSNLANVLCRGGDYAAAQSLEEEALALCREEEDRHGEAYALYGLGKIAVGQSQ
jgi:tetratricopeptide (TPR) repeat protein